MKPRSQGRNAAWTTTHKPTQTERTAEDRYSSEQSNKLTKEKTPQTESPHIYKNKKETISPTG